MIYGITSKDLRPSQIRVLYEDQKFSSSFVQGIHSYPTGLFRVLKLFHLLLFSVIFYSTLRPAAEVNPKYKGDTTGN